MSYFTKLNKKIEKAFNGKVHAELKSGCLYLTGELPDRDKVVQAGKMFVNKKKYTVVNDIAFKDGKVTPAKISPLASNMLTGSRPDVLVIGGGVVGCAIARELTQYKLDVMLLEKEHDVALHASGRNNGIIHCGHNLCKGKLRKKYTSMGNRMFPFICKELDVPFRYTGQYLCFSGAWIRAAAFLSLLYWKLKGIPAVYMSRRKLLEREPHLSKKIKFAIFFPDAGVVNPHGLTIAYAENAADNGAKICLDTAVLSIDVWNGKIVSVMTNHGRIYPKLVINAAGVFAQDIARLARDRFFSTYQKRGTNIIFDKKAAHLVNNVVSSLHTHQPGTAAGLCLNGGVIAHTAEGNLLAGSGFAETNETENFSIDFQSIRELLSKQRKTVPDLLEKDIITGFSGISALAYEEDYIISFGRFTSNIIHAAGIQFPGLTASPAIAVDVAKMAAEFLHAERNEYFDPTRKAIVRTAELPAYERDMLINKDSDYGEIVCRCKEISRGEVLAALRRNVSCDTIDGVKRRVRAGMGHCQGNYCSAHIAQIIAAEKKLPLSEVRKKSYNSFVISGDNKENL